MSEGGTPLGGRLIGEVLKWERQGFSGRGIPTGVKIGHNPCYISNGISGLFTVFLTGYNHALCCTFQIHINPPINHLNNM